MEAGDLNYDLTLIDFNIAVDFSEQEIRGPAGLKHWSAPETRSQSTYSEKCDLWGYGCLIYYLYSGGNNAFEESPISEETITENLNALREQLGKSDETDALISLIRGLWKIRSSERLTANEVICHPFFQQK